MTKHEAAWLSIRVTGLIIALSGIKQSSVFVYLIWIVLTGGLREMNKEFSLSMLSTTWPMALSGILMLAVGAYLLFAGRAVHNLVMKEE
jgi:uncharacterized membrane protein HdeD (DUF308 family)